MQRAALVRPPLRAERNAQDERGERERIEVATPGRRMEERRELHLRSDATRAASSMCRMAWGRLGGGRRIKLWHDLMVVRPNGSVGSMSKRRGATTARSRSLSACCLR